MSDVKKCLQDIGQDVKLIINKVHKIEIETAVNSKSLEEHMRRTEASENRIEKLEDREISEKTSQLKDKAVTGGITAMLLLATEIIRRLL